MKCPSCGAEVQENTKCEYCGAFVEQSAIDKEYDRARDLITQRVVAANKRVVKMLVLAIIIVMFASV
ncbi:MAG: zinc ribbon domain-containing protein, partial [Lachnospiraceae bacterium]|nr:zinc ribbon domain-containing protein [Lachnospiraceae bacterium]